MEHLPIPKPLSVNTLKFFRVPTPQHGKKLRIAIDLDSTLVNYTYLCTAAASLLDVPCAPTQNLEHYSLVPYIFTKEGMARVNKVVEHHAATHPLMDVTAPKAIRRLRTHGHKVDIITSRTHTKHMERAVAQFCDHHGIVVDNIVFTGDKGTKLHYDIIFDDAPHQLESIAKNSKTTPVRKPWPFNQHLYDDMPTAPNVTAIANWVLGTKTNNKKKGTNTRQDLIQKPIPKAANINTQEPAQKKTAQKKTAQKKGAQQKKTTQQKTTQQHNTTFKDRRRASRIAGPPRYQIK